MPATYSSAPGTDLTTNSGNGSDITTCSWCLIGLALVAVTAVYCGLLVFYWFDLLIELSFSFGCALGIIFSHCKSNRPSFAKQWIWGALGASIATGLSAMVNYLIKTWPSFGTDFLSFAALIGSIATIKGLAYGLIVSLIVASALKVYYQITPENFLIRILGAAIVLSVILSQFVPWPYRPGTYQGTKTLIDYCGDNWATSVLPGYERFSIHLGQISNLNPTNNFEFQFKNLAPRPWYLIAELETSKETNFKITHAKPESVDIEFHLKGGSATVSNSINKNRFAVRDPIQRSAQGDRIFLGTFHATHLETNKTYSLNIRIFNPGKILGRYTSIYLISDPE